MENDEHPLILTEAQWNAIYDDIYKLLKEYSKEGTTDEQLKQFMNGMKSIFTIDESQPLYTTKNLN
jgi:hypothetical protein